MGVVLDASIVTNVAGGLVLAALGAWVARLRPRTPLTTALAVYAVALGAGMAASNFRSADELGINVANFVVTTVGALLAAAAVVALGKAASPPPIDRRGAVPVAVGVLALFGFSMASFAVLGDARALTYGIPPGAPGTGSAWLVAATVAFFGFLAAAWAVLHLLALGALRDRARDPERIRRFALLTCGVALFPAVNAGTYWPFPPELAGAVPPWLPAPFFASQVLPAATLAALWLAIAARGAAPRAARNTALVVLGAVLAGMVFTAVGGLGAWGIARVAGAAVLAYGILRHRLLGLDVKVRWALSRSTLAALFIAVFFVASEGAQEFFGDKFGSAYLGIAAAGALVFAISPLSRLADRIAARAVPVAPAPRAPSHGAASDAEAAFRALAGLAMREGGLSREAERTLLAAAESMGLPVARAAALLDEVEGKEGPTR